MTLLKKSLCIAGLLLTGIILFITLALPSLIRSRSAEAVRKSYDRSLSFGKVSLNPLTLTVEARGITLSDKGKSAVFFACSSVRLKISPASIYHRAPVVSSIDIVSPYLHLIRKDATTYNFSDLIPTSKPDPDKKPFRFSFNNIRVTQGALDITDRLPAREQLQTVRNLEVRIPFASNLPYLAESYITPGMSARINGAPFSLEGKLKPFATRVESIVDLRLNGLDLPTYAAYLPATIPVRLVGGTVTTDLQITHRIMSAGEPALIVKGSARVTGLSIKDRRERPLLSVDDVAVRIREARIMAGVYDIDAVELTGPELHISRDRQGIVNLMQLLASSATPDMTPRPGQEKLKAVVREGMRQRKTERIFVNVAKVAVAKGRLLFSDDLPTGGFNLLLAPITLDLTGFSNRPESSARYALSFATNRKERFDLSGSFSVTPLAIASKGVFSGVVLEAAYPYLTTLLTRPVSGVLDGSADLSFTREAGPRVANLNLTLKKLALGFGGEEGLRIPEVTVQGGALNLKERQGSVERVAIKGGRVIASRGADGKLSPLTLLHLAAGGEVKGAAAATLAIPFRYAAKSVTVTGLDLGFTDHQKKGSPTFTLKKSTLSLANLSGPGSARMPLNFSAGFKDGSLASAGILGIEPLRFNGSCTLKGIPITSFDAYFPEELHLIIADGLMDTELKVALAATKEGMTGDLQGSVAVRRFQSLDEDDGEELLKWESLHLDGIKGVLKPFSLELDQVALTDFFARVTIGKDSTINLQKLYGSKAQPVAGSQAAPSSESKPAQTTAAAPPATAAVPAPRKIAIDAVTLQGGTLLFTDHHINPEFSATMYKLGGKINGLSSEQMKFADLDLRGNLRNLSPLSITGKINPLRGDLYVDAKVSFSDIELSPLTPYSGTYLGYTVDKGKLFLDLNYHIEKRQLASENRLFIDQFTFGESVESDKATKLPVRLAIALLKDSRGEIHLDLPVTGRTDDPQFSVWKVVGQILMNLLEKAATSPFKLLAAAFGDKENFSGVSFTPGSTELSSEETGKLAKLGKLLTDRPALNLEVTGFVDKERDPEGYRQELLLKKMKSEKFLALVKEKKNLPGQTADNLEMGPEESSRWLAAVYRKENFPKPRNVIGFAKELPDPEMKKLIFVNTPVGTEELTRLAGERTETVKNYLVTRAQVPRERVFEKSGALFELPKEAGLPPSRVEFGLVSK